MWVENIPRRAALRPIRGDMVRCRELPSSLVPIVEALLSGQTDETASRRLGISPRTYSRRVAELLEFLNVSTRFQGGAELVRRCWDQPQAVTPFGYRNVPGLARERIG